MQSSSRSAVRRLLRHAGQGKKYDETKVGKGRQEAKRSERVREVQQKKGRGAYIQCTADKVQEPSKSRLSLKDRAGGLCPTAGRISPAYISLHQHPPPPSSSHPYTLLIIFQSPFPFFFFCSLLYWPFVSFLCSLSGSRARARADHVSRPLRAWTDGERHQSQKSERERETEAKGMDLQKKIGGLIRPQPAQPTQPALVIPSLTVSRSTYPPADLVTLVPNGQTRRCKRNM